MWICLFAGISMKMSIKGGTQVWILKNCMNASTPLPFSKKTIVEVDGARCIDYRIKGHVDDFPEAQSNLQ
jgi:hypothetical protein